MFSATARRSLARSLRPRPAAATPTMRGLITWHGRQFVSPLQKPQAIASQVTSIVNGRHYASGFASAPEVDYATVRNKALQPSPNSYIVDVREPDEVAQGSIPSSVSIPLSGFEHSLGLPDIEFEAKHGFKKPAKDEEVIFYCRSGKRSTTASDEAIKRGYTNVKNYTGSWLDWVAKEEERKQQKKWDDDD